MFIKIKALKAHEKMSDNQKIATSPRVLMPQNLGVRTEKKAPSFQVQDF